MVRIDNALKKKLSISTAAASFFLCTLLGFGPAYLYFTNRSQFSFTYPEALVYLLPLFLVCVIVLVTGFSRLHGAVFEKSVSVLFAAALLFFIQGNVVLLDINPFTGRSVDWSAYRVSGVLELCAWILVLVLFALKAHIIYHHVQQLSLYFILFQCGILGIMFGFSDVESIASLFQTVPAAPTLISPQGHIKTDNPRYIWNDVPGANWYTLSVDGTSGWISKEYNGAEVCSQGTCSVRLAPYPHGHYTWNVSASRSQSQQRSSLSEDFHFSIGSSDTTNEALTNRKIFEDSSSRQDVLYDFSPQQNVILLVLDGFRSDIFMEIIQEDPAIKNEFNDFVYFYNAAAAYPSTVLSIPNIFTGQYYKNDIPLFQYIKESFLAHSLPKVLTMNAFQVDLIPPEPEVIYCDDSIATNCKALNTFEISHAHQILSLLNVTLFRYVPTLLKRPFVRAGTKFYHEGSLNAMYSFMRHATADAEMPTFKYLHFSLPHAPLQINEDLQYEPLRPTHANVKRQSKAALKIAANILSTLKTLHVFDQSLIMIISDHGFHPEMRFNSNLFGVTAGTLPSQFDPSELIPKASALLLVKPFATSPFAHSGELKMTDAPVALGDIPATVVQELGLDPQFSGQSLFTISESASRTRTFFNHPEWGLWKNWEYFPSLQQFYITGSIWEHHSWKMHREFDSIVQIEPYREFDLFQVKNTFQGNSYYIAVDRKLENMDLVHEKLGDRELPPYVFKSRDQSETLEKLEQFGTKPPYYGINTNDVFVVVSEELNTRQQYREDIFQRDFAPFIREFDLPPYLFIDEHVEQLQKRIDFVQDSIVEESAP